MLAQSLAIIGRSVVVVVDMVLVCPIVEDVVPPVVPEYVEPVVPVVPVVPVLPDVPVLPLWGFE